MAASNISFVRGSIVQLYFRFIFIIFSVVEIHRKQEDDNIDKSNTLHHIKLPHSYISNCVRFINIYGRFRGRYAQTNPS